MPGNKPASVRGPDQGPKEKNGPRKPRSHGFARRRMTPTRRVEHALETCPDCGTGLAGGWAQRSREVIEVPAVPVEVTEHVIVARTCPVCERRRVPKAALDGVTLGRQRLGINLVSLIATLKEEGRMPVRTIQWYLETVHQLHLSEGGRRPGAAPGGWAGSRGYGPGTRTAPGQPGSAGRRDRMASGRGKTAMSGPSAPSASGTSCAAAGIRG